MQLEDDTDQLMVMAAHRYCLGRRSYIVGECVRWLKQTWPQCVENTRFVILRDTIEAVLRHRAGMAIDENEWREFLRWAGARESTELIGRLLYNLRWLELEAGCFRYLLGIGKEGDLRSSPTEVMAEEIEK